MATIRREITIDEKLFEDFKRHFPDGSLSWACGMLLEKFIEQYKQTPAEYAQIAAQILKEEIT